MKDLLYQVDAFTDEPFKGNPAAVVLLKKPRSDRWMRQFAAEMALSETAYLIQKEGAWELRWFTPVAEVNLCGHATLASARVLFERHPHLRSTRLTFHTQSGALHARWVDGAIELDFPALEPREMSFEPDVDRAFGCPFVSGHFAGDFVMFVAKDAKSIRKARPDMAAVSRLPATEFIITAKSDDPAYDFVSRFFAPELGIDEDPVTGSAHCMLAPYWAKELGKTDLIACQASPRGGILHLTLRDDRTLIQGDARIIFSGELWI